jgi:translation initiation factor IF-1
MTTDAETIRVPGLVIATLGEAAFRVRLSNGHELVAHVPRRLKSPLGPILSGVTVELELSPFDLSRCRIVGRHEASPAAP